METYGFKIDFFFTRKYDGRYCKFHAIANFNFIQSWNFPSPARRPKNIAKVLHNIAQYRKISHDLRIILDLAGLHSFPPPPKSNYMNFRNKQTGKYIIIFESVVLFL